MSWRLAKSLETLRTQVNVAYPNRSKASDGTIGDAAHASQPSDHNPNASGVVCALDLTHDPKNGFDAHKTADTMLKNRHSNLKYLISNRRIAGAWTGWKWQAYTGSNPHDKHIHVSVGRGSDGRSVQPYDDTTKWIIKENEMITQSQLGVLYRMYLGRTVDSSGVKTFVGKKTFDQTQKAIIASAEYKGVVSRSKAGTLKAQNHLPSAVRNVYKTPAVEQYEPVTETLYRKK